MPACQLGQRGARRQWRQRRGGQAAGVFGPGQLAQQALHLLGVCGQFKLAPFDVAPVVAHLLAAFGQGLDVALVRQQVFVHLHFAALRLQRLQLAGQQFLVAPGCRQGQFGVGQHGRGVGWQQHGLGQLSQRVA
jgi:hypothetical protein